MPSDTATRYKSRPVTRASRLSPEARRAQLVQAALRTFAARGIGETSHTALAQEAQVAVPTVFHYFSSKEAVIEAVLQEVSRFLLDELLTKNDDPARTAPEAIEQVLMSFCDAIDTHTDYIRVWLEWSVSIRGELWESYLVFYRSALTGIRKILQRGIAESSVRAEIDLDDSTRVIVGLAHMIVQMKFSGGTRDQVAHTVRSLLNNYLQLRQEQ